MAIQYEKKEFVLNFKEGKPTMYRIAAVKPQQVTFDKLLDEVATSCGVGRAQVKASIEGLIDRMSLFMEYGMSVKLGDFGSFKPAINVKAQKSVDDLGVENVTRRKILYTPGKRFKNMLSAVSITRAVDEINVKTSEDTGGNNNGGGGGGDEFIDPSA
ncbi:HU family DNA-binding protein [Bacteroides sp. 224]|uniref:HU family DNA-binding protein n=1 Tax=Bacteroides sp. 224 TaxID=2302936 RepID=UPI0013D2C386|nr:HU family DNA-binding protein [Bacteroides sp. 224]NDV66704.1 DNA-binding protein [Bacteroides sp. 224]